MTATEAHIEYRRLRVPREHGSALIQPPLVSAPRLLGENIALRDSYDSCDIQGQSLLALSEEARRLLLSEAARYTAGYRDVAVTATRIGEHDSPTVLLAGHQPQPSHAGVWFKDFVLDALARSHGAVGIQLLIDNDVLRTASVRVPTGSVSDPAVEGMLLDRPAGELPYEERGIDDLELFGSFAERVRRAMRLLVPDPLVTKIWPAAVEAARAHGNLGRAVAQARHRLEGEWGLETLELPLSRVCDSRPFRRFLLHLLERLPTLHRLHNQVLDQYRQANRIRSRSHPVPDLAVEGPWLEAPFWIWTRTDPRRYPLFVRSSGDVLHCARAGPREPAGLPCTSTWTAAWKRHSTSYGSFASRASSCDPAH